MQNFTDALFSDLVLTETALTPLEKMQAWDAGTRRENIKACSDQKLLSYYNIIIANNLNNVRPIIEKELAARNLLQVATTTASSSANYKFNAEDWVRQNLRLCLPTKSTIDEIIWAKHSIVQGLYTTGALVASFGGYRPKIISAFVAAILLHANELAAALQAKLVAMGFTSKSIMPVFLAVQADAQLYTDLVNDSLALATATDPLLSATKPLQETVEKHDKLNPKLWTAAETLRPEVKDKIALIVEEFVTELQNEDITISIKDIILIGSNCSYNYNEGSDLDVHILADAANLACPERYYSLLYSAYRSIFNKKFDIDFYGIPVELFVETSDTKTVSNGIYSVLYDHWIKHPVATDIPDIDQEKLNELLGKWTVAYNKAIASNDIDQITAFIEAIYELRKQALSDGNEYDIRNLVFKELRNAGDLDNLKDIKNELKAKQMSL